jgi:hypothetical protein
MASVAAGAVPAFADTSSDTSTPDAVVCDPASGTVLTSKAVAATEAWLPTSLSSSYEAGPAVISRTVSSTSTVSTQLSASFKIKEGFLFVSAEETYGITVGSSVAHTSQWTYAATVKAGYTDKVQQYHLGYEIGIRQTYVGAPGQHCQTQTETSLTGNFFPVVNTADDTY